MIPRDFIKKTRPGNTILIEESKYKVVQKLKWLMLIADESYFKYVLEDKHGKRDYRFVPDAESGRFLLCRFFKNKLIPPFPKKIKLKGKSFNFIYGEWCRVDKVWGERVYKIGDEEIWWDYEDKKNNYLSLGWDEKTGKREDLIGKWISSQKVRIF